MTGASGPLRIGTRGSRLALAQTQIVVDALRAARVADDMETVVIRTTGDRISEQLPRGGWEDADGQFTGELESALLGGAIDLAVHSHKDLPTASTPGVTIAAVLARGDARDCLVVHERANGALPAGARIGTSSVRRSMQLSAAHPDVEILPIRGNIDTRMRRLAEGEYDALLLAAAGLDRLGVAFGEVQKLDFGVMLPAPAQGALAIQSRVDDVELIRRLAAVDDAATRAAVAAERALLREVGGGCLAPLGAFADVDGGSLRLRAAYGESAASIRRVDVRGVVDEPFELAGRAAAQIRPSGATTLATQ